MMNLGIFGVGHLGKIHIQQWLKIQDVNIMGFYDPDDKNAQEVEKLYNLKRYSAVEDLLNDVELIDIVSPTSTHYQLAKPAIKAGKHLFIEKPFANTIEEGKELIKLIKEAGVKCQVGHVERYNPAFTVLSQYSISPLFIEAHRLAQFDPRGTDVSVILDLMIHDIDIVLSLVNSEVKNISASGVSVVSNTADIANARIEFDNGCVANLTSSRISLKKMRKARLFQRDAYIGIDFLDKKTEIIKIDSTAQPNASMSLPIKTNEGEQRIISVDMPKIPTTNAIFDELSDFVNAIKHNKPTLVSEIDGYLAMEVAHQILHKMKMMEQLHTI